MTPDLISVRILRMPHAEGLDPPSYQTAGAAGLDLSCAIDPGVILPLAPGERLLAPTGFSIELPAGFEAQVRPRSGLAANYGITVLNSPGTIDSDYRGEIKVILYNAGQETFRLERGMRIAQMVIAPVTRAQMILVEQLSETERADGGFGSTGTIASARS